MSEPKHTPTPWVVRSEMPTDCSDGTRWTIVHDQPYYDRPTRFIASMCGTMPTIEGESESNAALIVRAVEHIAEVIPPSVATKVRAALRAAKGES